MQRLIKLLTPFPILLIFIGISSSAYADDNTVWDGEAPLLHVIEKGETLSLIAEKFYSPFIKKKNPEETRFLSIANKLQNNNELKVGQQLLIPPVSEIREYIQKENKDNYKVELKKQFYQFQKGDTLSKLSMKLLSIENYDLSARLLTEGIQKINPQIVDTTKIEIGTIIKLPHISLMSKLKHYGAQIIHVYVKKDADDFTLKKKLYSFDKRIFDPTKNIYRVKEGESLSSIIFKKYPQREKKLSDYLKTLQEINPEIKNVNEISKGHDLILPYGKFLTALASKKEN